MVIRTMARRLRTVGLIGAAALGIAAPASAAPPIRCDDPKQACPPPFVHTQEGPPRIKIKDGCAKPVCPPCGHEFFGYYPTIWRTWPSVGCPQLVEGITVEPDAIRIDGSIKVLPRMPRAEIELRPLPEPKPAPPEKAPAPKPKPSDPDAAPGGPTLQPMSKPTSAEPQAAPVIVVKGIAPAAETEAIKFVAAGAAWEAQMLVRGRTLATPTPSPVVSQPVVKPATPAVSVELSAREPARPIAAPSEMMVRGRSVTIVPETREPAPSTKPMLESPAARPAEPHAEMMVRGRSIATTPEPAVTPSSQGVKQVTYIVVPEPPPVPVKSPAVPAAKPVLEPTPPTASDRIIRGRRGP